LSPFGYRFAAAISSVIIATVGIVSMAVVISGIGIVVTAKVTIPIGVVITITIIAPVKKGIIEKGIVISQITGIVRTPG
jgi:hypothetical protein